MRPFSGYFLTLTTWQRPLQQSQKALQPHSMGSHSTVWQNNMEVSGTCHQRDLAQLSPPATGFPREWLWFPSPLHTELLLQ